MTTPSELQTLLRFLSQDAKLPMAKALSTIKPLQSAQLTTPSLIASSSTIALAKLLPDKDKRTAKQILSAAKRISQKRLSSDPSNSLTVTAPPPTRRERKSQFELKAIDTDDGNESAESSLALPVSNRDVELIQSTTLITNRAPLVLAFGVVLLKYTMPGQPLSSRLSLAQAAVSMNSRSKAVSLGIEKGKSAEEEGWGMGQAVVRVMGREVRTMRREGWEDDDGGGGESNGIKRKDEGSMVIKNEDDDTKQKPLIEEKIPAYWALDLEALKKHNGGFNDGTGVGLGSSLPIYTPQSARAYLMKSFTARVEPPGQKPVSKGRAQFAKRVEENVSLLLGALELLFESWSSLSREELDRRAWNWYVQVRPDVADGVAGWGAKGELRLQRLLDLRQTP